MASLYGQAVRRESCLHHVGRQCRRRKPLILLQPLSNRSLSPVTFFARNNYGQTTCPASGGRHVPWSSVPAPSARCNGTLHAASHCCSSQPQRAGDGIATIAAGLSQDSRRDRKWVLVSHQFPSLKPSPPARGSSTRRNVQRGIGWLIYLARERKSELLDPGSRLAVTSHGCDESAAASSTMTGMLACMSHGVAATPARRRILSRQVLPLLFL